MMRKAIPLGFAGWLLFSVSAMAACLSPTEVQRAIAGGHAQRLSAIVAAVEGDIVSAELCDSGSQLVYRLAVMKGGGRVVTVLVDAKTGEPLK